MKPQEKLAERHEYVARYLRTYGTTFVAKRVGVTASSVRRYAQRHDLPILARAGHLRLSEAAVLIGLERESVKQRALSDGVLLRPRPTPDVHHLPVWVPESWARQQAEEARQLDANRQLLEEGAWLTRLEAARYIGVGSRTITLGLAGEGMLGAVLADAPRRHGVNALGGKRVTLIEPRAVEAARAAYERAQYKTAGWLTRKRLAGALNWSITHLRRRLTHLGIEGELRHVGKTRERVYPPGTLERLRERWRE